jgi:GAF domain-containing protein
MNEPIPVSEGLRGLCRFLLRSTQAAAGVLVVRRHDPGRRPAEEMKAFPLEGTPFEGPLVDFRHSYAGASASVPSSALLADLRDPSASQGVQIQPFEKGRTFLLAATLLAEPGLTVVLELFDKQGSGSFSQADRQLVTAAAGFAGDLIRHALSQRDQQQMLMEAVAAALRATEGALPAEAELKTDQPVAQVLQELKDTLTSSPQALLNSAEAIRLAGQVHALVSHHGPEAARFCASLLEQVDHFLQKATSLPEGPP